MTPKRLEQSLYLAAALVSGVGPFTLHPIAAGIVFAVLHLAMAVCIQLRQA